MTSAMIKDIVSKALGKEKNITEAGGHQKYQTEDYPGIDVAEQITLSKPKVDLTVEKYLSRGLPADFDKRLAKFKHLPTFAGIPGYKFEREDFPDIELVSEPAIFLREIDDKETCELGYYFFTEISAGISRSLLGILFLLAFQLKVPGTKSIGRVFPSRIEDPFSSTRDVPYLNLEKQSITTSQSRAIFTESGNIEDDAKAYAFLAASMLRLFARAPENFVKAWKHIQDGYSSFYNDPLPINGISMNIDTLKAIHRQFSLDPLMKSTLFRILYYTNDTDGHESIKNFLYKIHLSYTGMHIVPIFVRLCVELKCTSGCLLRLFKGGEFDKQISSLEKLLSLSADVNGAHRRKMWIYGRIFDQNFMSSLQTKNCRRFVYILAAALRREKPHENAGVTNIVQLQDLSADDKKRCEMAAERLILLVRRYTDTDDTNHAQDHAQDSGNQPTSSSRPERTICKPARFMN